MQSIDLRLKPSNNLEDIILLNVLSFSGSPNLQTYSVSSTFSYTGSTIGAQKIIKSGSSFFRFNIPDDVMMYRGEVYGIMIDCLGTKPCDFYEETESNMIYKQGKYFVDANLVETSSASLNFRTVFLAHR